MTTKETEKKLRQAAEQLEKYVDERKAEVLAAVFMQIEKADKQ